MLRPRWRTVVGRVPVAGRGQWRADVELGGCGRPAPEPPVHGHRSHAGRRPATAERHSQALGGSGRPIGAASAARQDRVPVQRVPGPRLRAIHVAVPAAAGVRGQ